MSILETLRSKLLEARKGGQAAHMATLQVILGDASMIEARSGKKASDEEIEKIIRKLVVGNTETIAMLKEKGMADHPDVATRTAENAFLQTLLPQTLNVADIKTQLVEVADAIKGAKNDGMATGIAMKHLKGKSLKVLGEDVSAAIRELRK
jgi:uncharacterized protein YqeY